MSWTIIIIETIILTAAFTAMILIPLVKNPVWWIADYPEDIQEEYFKTHERISSKFFSPTVLLKKGMALLIALALLLLVVKLAGAYDFWSALGVGYGIWLFIDWYDCFFLDWVLFANMKNVRLPGTEHMDEAYHQKKYHFIQSCWGMLIGLIPCLIYNPQIKLYRFFKTNCTIKSQGDNVKRCFKSLATDFKSTLKTCCM